MIKEKLNSKESKNKIRPRIKIRINPIQNKVIPSIGKSKEQNSNLNSNSKSITNSKTNKDILISNTSGNTSRQKNYEKIVVNNVTSEDRDIETLLSELRTTFIQKTKSNNKENINEEDLNINFNKNNNFYLLYNNDGFYFEKKRESNEFNFIDLNFDLDEPGHEISQRVHTKKARTHYKILPKQNRLNNINKKFINYKYMNIFHNKAKVLKNNANSINKDNSKSKNISNLKISLMKKSTSFSQNRKKVIIKNKTSNNRIRNIPILDKLSSIPKNINQRNFALKRRQTQYKSIQQNLLTEIGKIYKSSDCKNASISNKSEINSPKGYKIDRTINFEHKTKCKIDRTKNMYKNNSNNRIGELYIRNKYQKIKTEKNKIKIINFKRNKSNRNPFNKSYAIEKTPIIKKISSFIDNIFEKSDMKRSFDGYCANKKQHITKKLNCNNKKQFKMKTKIYSTYKKEGRFKYNNLKEYYSNLCFKRPQFYLNKKKIDHLFSMNKDIKYNKNHSILFNNKKNKFRYNNSVRNIEITL